MIRFVQTGGTVEATTNPATTTSFSSTSGDLLVVAVGADSVTAGDITAGAVSDNKGNVFTRVMQQVGNTMQVNLFYSAGIIGGAGHTVSVANAIGDDVAVVVQEFAGMDQTSPLQDSKSATGITTNPTTGATTTTPICNYYLVVAALCSDDSTPSDFTLGAGFTNLGQKGGGFQTVSLASKIATTSSFQTGNFGSSAVSSNWDIIVANFAAARPSILVQRNRPYPFSPGMAL